MNYFLKCVCVGDSNVGKTYIFMSYSTDEFPVDYTDDIRKLPEIVYNRRPSTSPEVIEVCLTHLRNSQSLMLVRPCGKVREVIPSHPSNALLPMLVIPCGKVRAVIPSHPANAR